MKLSDEVVNLSLLDKGGYINWSGSFLFCSKGD